MIYDEAKRLARLLKKDRKSEFLRERRIVLRAQRSGINQKIKEEIDPILRRNPVLRTRMLRFLEPMKNGVRLTRGVPMEVQYRNIYATAFSMCACDPTDSLSYEDEKSILRKLDTSCLTDGNGASARGRSKRLPRSLDWSQAIRLESIPENDYRFPVARKIVQLGVQIYYNQFPWDARWNCRGLELLGVASQRAAAKIIKAAIEDTPEGRTAAFGLKGGKFPFKIPSVNEVSKVLGGGKDIRKSLSRKYGRLLDVEISELCAPPYRLMGRFWNKHFYMD